MTTLIKLAGITLPGTGYPGLINFASPNLPQAGSLVGLYMLGGLEAIAQKNLVTGLPGLAKSGAPVVSNLGIALDYQNYYETQLASTAEMTFVSIAKPIAAPIDAATSGVIASNYAAGANGGDTLTLYSGGLSVFMSTTAGANNTAPLALTGADVTKWNIFIGRIKADGRGQCWWGHDGATVAGVESAANARAIQTGRKLRIGGIPSNGFRAKTNQALLGIYNTALSDADVTATITYLRSTIGPALGITTL